MNDIEMNSSRSSDDIPTTFNKEVAKTTLLTLGMSVAMMEMLGNDLLERFKLLKQKKHASYEERAQLFSDGKFIEAVKGLENECKYLNSTTAASGKCYKMPDWLECRANNEEPESVSYGIEKVVAECAAVPNSTLQKLLNRVPELLALGLSQTAAPEGNRSSVISNHSTASRCYPEDFSAKNQEGVYKRKLNYITDKILNSITMSPSLAKRAELFRETCSRESKSELTRRNLPSIASTPRLDASISGSRIDRAGSILGSYSYMAEHEDPDEGSASSDSEDDEMIAEEVSSDDNETENENESVEDNNNNQEGGAMDVDEDSMTPSDFTSALCTITQTVTSVDQVEDEQDNNNNDTSSSSSSSEEEEEEDPFANEEEEDEEDLMIDVSDSIIKEKNKLMIEDNEDDRSECDSDGSLVIVIESRNDQMDKREVSETQINNNIENNENVNPILNSLTPPPVINPDTAALLANSARTEQKHSVIRAAFSRVFSALTPSMTVPAQSAGGPSSGPTKEVLSPSCPIFTPGQRVLRSLRPIPLKDPRETARFTDDEQELAKEFTGTSFKPTKVASWCKLNADWYGMVRDQADIDPWSIFGCGIRPVQYKDVFRTPDFRRAFMDSALEMGEKEKSAFPTTEKRGGREKRWNDDQLHSGFDNAGEVPMELVDKFRKAQKCKRDVSNLVYELDLASIPEGEGGGV